MSTDGEFPVPKRDESSEDDDQELQRVVRLRMSSGGKLTPEPIEKSKPEERARASGRI